MKVIVKRNDLDRALKTLKPVITTKTSLSILSNVQIEATRGRLTLTATDLQVGIEVSIPAKVNTDGKTTLPHNVLAPLVAKQPKGSEIEIEANTEDKENAEDKAKITCGRLSFDLLGISTDEFPAFPTIENPDITFSIDGGCLCDMLKRTSYAVSREDSRYALMGQLFTMKDETLRVVATDGRRLATDKWTIYGKDGQKEGETNWIVPLKCVEILQKLLKEGLVSVATKDHSIKFDVANTGIKVISRLIDGTFPDYEKVIPAEWKNTALLNRVDLLNLIDRLKTTTSVQSELIKLRFENGTLAGTSYTPEVGKTEGTVDVEYSGDPLTIAVNPHYLAEAIRVLKESEFVNIKLTSPLDPIGIYAESNSDYQAVVMPMRSEDSDDTPEPKAENPEPKPIEPTSDPEDGDNPEPDNVDEDPEDVENTDSGETAAEPEDVEDPPGEPEDSQPEPQEYEPQKHFTVHWVAHVYGETGVYATDISEAREAALEQRKHLQFHSIINIHNYDNPEWSITGIEEKEEQE